MNLTIGRKARVAGIAVLVVLVVTGGVLWAVLGSSSAASAASCSGGSPKLTVIGTGTATAAPDLLTVTVDVDVTASSAAAALAQNNTDTAAVLAAFTQGGVASKDLQTTNLSVQPTYVYIRGRQVPSTYEVNNTIQATMHDLSTAGTTLDAVVNAGGNDLSIDSLNFSLQNPQSIQDDARTNAVRQAASHAGSMAIAAGDHLGALCSLNDNSSITPEPLPGGVFKGLANGTAQPAVPLSGGTQQASAQVTLIYALAGGTTAASHVTQHR
jgi:uncharacterized protein YggE